MNDLISEYFNHWKNSDPNDLISLFDDDAKYQIDNLDRTYFGRDEIYEYFKKNAERQRNIDIEYDKKLTNKQSVSCNFRASFDDITENEHQTIFGDMCFVIDDETNKIIMFRERYKISRVQIGDNKIKEALKSVNRYMSMLRIYIADTLRYFLSAIMFLFYIIVVIILILGLSIWISPFSIEYTEYTLKFYDYFLNNQHNVTDNDKIIQVKMFFSYLTGFAGVSIALFVFFGRKFSRTREILSHTLRGRDSDLRIMNKYMKNSDEVVIFSGDFDFLPKNVQLFKTIYELCKRNKISFLSDKSKREVFSLDDDKSLEIFRSLDQSGRFFYDSGLNIRSSFIRRSGDRYFITKSVQDTEVSSVPKIFAFVNRGRARKVIDEVHRLVQYIMEINKRDYDVLRQTEEDLDSTFLLVITGKTKSGKTKLSKEFIRRGFSYFSAGDFVKRELEKEEKRDPSRRDLLQKGGEMLREDGGNGLGVAMTQEFMRHPNVVLDGIRLRGTIDFLSEHFDHLKIVYVETESAVRRRRYEAINDESIDFDALDNHEVEVEVGNIRKYANIIIDGESSIGSNFEKIEKYLNM